MPRSLPRSLALALVAACGDAAATPDAALVDGGGPDAAPQRLTVAVLVDGDAGVELHVQARDGSGRTRIHFADVTEFAPNVGSPAPAVTDANIVTLGPMRWSPDGDRLAVVVGLGADISEVVIVDLAHQTLAEASLDLHVVTTGLDWSLDGTRLGYGLSTDFLVTQTELFVTDLVAQTSTQLTDNSDPDFDLAEVRFDEAGQALRAGRRIPPAGPGEATDEIVSVDLATQTMTSLGTVTGTATSLARSGGWALTVRLPSPGLDRWLGQHDLVNDEVIEVLPPAAQVRWAQLLDGDGAALVAVEPTSAAAADRVGMLDLAAPGTLAAIANVTDATQVAVWQAP